MHISQEAGKVVWYSHLLKNFPHFVVIHTVKVFGVVNKAEVDVSLELSCFFYDPQEKEMKRGKMQKGSSKKQESSRKTSTSALLTTPKLLTVWITTNRGKFSKRWEYQTT